MSSKLTVDQTLSSLDEVDHLAAAVMSFVRNIGLLQPNRTPCGKPLSVSQAHALHEIRTQPGITQRDLANDLGLAAPTVSELVAQLTDRGWVNQAPSEADRRQRRLTVTEAGREVTEAIAKARRNLILEVVAELTPEERTLVVGATQLLAEGAQQRRNRTINLGP